MDYGVLATAALLGVTHAAEPDHVAGIVGLAGDGGRARAAFVGGCFAAGHVALVVCWVVAGTLVLDAIPGVAGAVGDAALGIVLLAAAAFVGRDALDGVRTGGSHSHANRFLARADGGSRPLTFGVVGALFTLSPPVTMLGFVTAVLPDAGAGGAWLVVGAYAVSIVTAMAAVGALGAAAVDALGGIDDRVATGGKLVAALALAWLGLSTLGLPTLG